MCLCLCGDALVRELPVGQLWLGQQFKATRETEADDTWQKSIINNRYSTQRARGKEAWGTGPRRWCG